MSKPICAVLLLALTCAPLTLHAGDQGAPYFRHGEQSMTAKNYDQAYVDFKKAAELSPDNVEYEISMQRAQFAAANEHIRKGETYKASKSYELAQQEMERAVAIDPSNFVATQELQAIKDLIHPPPPPPGEAVGTAQAATLQQRLARAAGPVELGPVANTTIRDFTVNSDPKNAYLAAGKLAGLNVIFDASSQGGYSNTGRVSLDLHNLSLLDILHVLDVATDSFYTPITSNTILVANDSVQKHQAVDQTVLKVFYIKNVQAPTDLTELAQALRGLMQPQPHIVPVASVNALVMRDTPDKVAMVQKLLDDLDKAPPEVVVDVRILQVSRDRAQDLGLLPPTSFSIGLQAPSTSNSSSTTGSSTTTGTTTTGTTNSPTLNELTHLNSSNFAVTIPNATLNALLNDSNTQTIQEPQLRAIQGQKATLQIGQKIPVATGSFQPGIGGVGINPLVNTQFTQQPVGVNIDMTPQIHGDNSVLLKERIEISNVDSYVNLGGIQQPVIGNRLIDHTIELRNGQSSVLGGMMVNTVTHNVNGIPGLSQIPLFKYLFSSTHDETQHSEIVIVLTPHIVHSLNITAQDERALDTGTQDNVELRELPPAQLQTPAAPPSGSEPAAPAPGAAAPPPAPEGPQLVILPARPAVQVGKPFTVSLDLKQAKDAYALTFQLNYDPKLLEVQAMNLGEFLSSDAKVPALVHREDADTGTAQVSLSRPPNASGLSGGGTVLTVTFMPKAAGESPLSLSRLGARGPGGAPQPLTAAAATVEIKQ
ncbi:MAG TPA: secretin N-terminal domain-containing protein [Terriglobales bacterium]